MPIKKYTCFFIFFVGLITIVLTTVNYTVDPYMIFQSKRFVGFNEKKPAAANRSTLYKPYNVIAIQPSTIIAGNSRPEMGINPDSNCWPDSNRSVYSLTFPGLSTYGQVRAVFHAISTEHVKTVLLGVDFSDFLDKRDVIPATYWPKSDSEFYNRLLVNENNQPNHNYWFYKLKDFSTALFSLDALNDVGKTLMLQAPNTTTRTISGFNPARDYLDIIKYEGAWVLFEQKKKELEKNFLRTGLSIYDLNGWSIEFESIKRIIELAIEKEIKLIVFINPYHYSYLEIIRSAGYWDEFETFKRGIYKVVKKYGKDKVALWDFSLYSKYTVSAVPTKASKANLTHWFWEPAHYKAELGELMLADIFDSRCASEINKPVGVDLKTIDINDHLENQETKRIEILTQMPLRGESL